MLFKLLITVIPYFATQLVKQDYSTTYYVRNNCFATRLYPL
jgi:hypothetical protein